MTPAALNAIASTDARSGGDDLRGSRSEYRLARRGGSVELLRIPALVFGAAACARRGAYDRRWLPSARLPVPVISVGNLSTGGTGKTPMCAWLVRELATRGMRPGILSRGYRATNGANDEALLLARECPGVPQVQDARRVRGARALIERGVDVIVLDDGFQHRRLQRDVDLVLIDATRPWGLPRVDANREPVRALLPRGLLREPPSSLARADAIVITRTEQVSAREVADLERAIERCAPGRPLLRARHATRRLRDEHARAAPVEALAGREVDLVSAIGNPEAFEASVRATGAIVRAHRMYPDHHAYRREDLDDLGSSARTARPLVTTAKDAVKLAPLGIAFLALEIELEIVEGRPVLEALLDALQTHEAAIALKLPRRLRGSSTGGGAHV